MPTQQSGAKLTKWLIYQAYSYGSSVNEWYRFITTVLNCEITWILKVHYLETEEAFSQ